MIYIIPISIADCEVLQARAVFLFLSSVMPPIYLWNRKICILSLYFVLFILRIFKACLQLKGQSLFFSTSLLFITFALNVLHRHKISIQISIDLDMLVWKLCKMGKKELRSYF